MKRRSALRAAACLAAAPVVRAQETGQHRHGDQRDRHGNPADLEAYIARLLDPARDTWQQPDRLVAALGLRRGQRVCDIGAGPGYLENAGPPPMGSSPACKVPAR